MKLFDLVLCASGTCGAKVDPAVASASRLDGLDYICPEPDSNRQRPFGPRDFKSGKISRQPASTDIKAHYHKAFFLCVGRFGVGSCPIVRLQHKLQLQLSYSHAPLSCLQSRRFDLAPSAPRTRTFSASGGLGFGILNPVYRSKYRRHQMFFGAVAIL